MKINYKICCDAKYFIDKLNYFYKKKQNYINWINYCNKLKKKFPIVQKNIMDLKKM